MPKAIEKLNQLLVESVINPPETITIPRTLLVEFLADYNRLTSFYRNYQTQLELQIESLNDLVHNSE